MGVGILMRQKHCCAVCKTRQTDNTLQLTPTNNIEQNRALLKSVETLRLYAAVWKKPEKKRKPSIWTLQRKEKAAECKNPDSKHREDR